MFDPKDPYMMMRRVMLMVLMVVFPAACTGIGQCRAPASQAAKVVSCTLEVNAHTLP